MSDETIQILVPAVLIVHGIGHWMGIMTAAGLAQTDNWHSRSWLLTEPLGETNARIIALILWVVTFVGFLAAGVGAAGWSPLQDSWRTIAVIASILSLIALALFWNAFVALFPNKIGSIVVNVGTLVAVWVMDFPATDVIK
jgi:hypothetical protein